MNPLDFIPKSLLGIVIIALLTTNFSCAIKNGQLELEVSRAATKLAEVQKEHAEQVLAAQVAYNNVTAAYRKKEQVLQAVADEERKKNEALYAVADTDADALRLRLSKAVVRIPRSAEDRPTSATASIGQVTRVDDLQELSIGTGLVDETLRAEKIRINLLSCYKQYDEAVEKINGKD